VALQTVAAVWEQVNAFPAGKYPALTPPLVAQVALAGGIRPVTLAEFKAMIGALEQAAEALARSEQQLRSGLQARRQVQESIRVALAAYVKTIRGRFPATSQAVRTLPKRRS
jgi:hypothetical protein